MFEDVNKKKRLLLVDDDEIHLITAELFLKDEYEVYKTRSGNEALEYLNNNESLPDIILLDIIMPNMDGWEVFKRVKKTDKLKNIPVMFLTSIMGENEKKRARKIGIAGFIVKPFNMTDLKNRIKEVLKKYSSVNIRKGTRIKSYIC